MEEKEKYRAVEQMKPGPQKKNQNAVLNTKGNLEAQSWLLWPDSSIFLPVFWFCVPLYLLFLAHLVSPALWLLRTYFSVYLSISMPVFYLCLSLCVRHSKLINSKTNRIGRSPLSIETPIGQTTSSRLSHRPLTSLQITDFPVNQILIQSLCLLWQNSIRQSMETIV